jgi:hypothetical protein
MLKHLKGIVSVFLLFVIVNTISENLFFKTKQSLVIPSAFQLLTEFVLATLFYLAFWFIFPKIYRKKEKSK